MHCTHESCGMTVKVTQAYEDGDTNMPPRLAWALRRLMAIGRRISRSHISQPAVMVEAYLFNSKDFSKINSTKSSKLELRHQLRVCKSDAFGEYQIDTHQTHHFYKLSICFNSLHTSHLVHTSLMRMAFCLVNHTLTQPVRIPQHLDTVFTMS
jgi:hypothetical protein